MNNINKENAIEFMKQLVKLIKMIEKEKIDMGNNTKINLSLFFGEINNEGEIGKDELWNYFQEQQIIYSKNECDYFIKQFDKDYSTGLNFEEFMNIFLSINNDKLNQYLSNNIFIIKKNEKEWYNYINKVFNSIFFLFTFIGESNIKYETVFDKSTDQIEQITFFNLYKEIIDKEDCKMIFKFLDYDNDKYISKSDFDNLFIPLKKDSQEAGTESYKLEYEFTKEKMDNFMNILGEIENKLENERMLLFSNEEITVNKIFKMFSQHDDNKLFISIEDIHNTLFKYEFFADHRDINLLFSLINVKQPGLFAFEEFISLFIPYNIKVNNSVSFKVSFLPLTYISQKQICYYLYNLIHSEIDLIKKKEEIFHWSKNIIKLQPIYQIFKYDCNSHITKEYFISLFKTKTPYTTLIWHKLTQKRSPSSISIINIVSSLYY